MKRFLIPIPLLFLFSLNSLFANSLNEKNNQKVWDEIRKAEDTFQSSLTTIIEAKPDYIVIENLSSKIGGFLIEKKTGNKLLKLNGEYTKIADKECSKFNMRFPVGHENQKNKFELLSNYSGKFFCISELSHLESKLEQSEWLLSISQAKEDKSHFRNEILEIKNKINSIKKETIRKDNEASDVTNLASIEKKQQTCKTLGFEVGTPPNGECVLKLMELETKVAESTQTIINNNSGSDEATVNALAETQRQMLIQQQSQALMNLGSTLMNSGQPKINCRQTLTGFSCY